MERPESEEDGIDTHQQSPASSGTSGAGINLQTEEARSDGRCVFSLEPDFLSLQELNMFFANRTPTYYFLIVTSLPFDWNGFLIVAVGCIWWFLLSRPERAIFSQLTIFSSYLTFQLKGHRLSRVEVSAKISAVVYRLHRRYWYWRNV